MSVLSCSREKPPSQSAAEAVALGGNEHGCICGCLSVVSVVVIATNATSTDSRANHNCYLYIYVHVYIKIASQKYIEIQNCVLCAVRLAGY